MTTTTFFIAHNVRFLLMLIQEKKVKAARKRLCECQTNITSVCAATMLQKGEKRLTNFCILLIFNI